MSPGATANATAQVFGSGGAAMGAGTYTLAWRSSNTAAVTVSPQGGLRAAGPGAAWIVATAGTARDSVRITVAAPAPTVAAVDIAGGDVSLEVGDAARPLTASVLDSNRQPVQRPVTWSSSNPGVASVDGSGRVTPMGAGTAQITASADGRTDQVSVTVVAAAAPAPTPAPVAAAPALPSAAETRSAVETYVAALGANDRDTVTRLWGSAPEGDRGDLFDVMGSRQLTMTLGTVSTPVSEGAAAVVTFQVAANYRSSFGQNRDSNFNFRARLERSGAEWRLASSVLQ